MEVSPVYVSIKDACKLVSIGRTTIYSSISTGELPSYKIGNRRLIKVADLLCWIEENPAEEVIK